MAKRPVRARTRTRARRAIDIPQGHEGTMEVKRQGYGNNDEDTEMIRVPSFIGPVGRVAVEGSVTRNMGDYNSIKVGVRVEMPCYPTPGEVDRCYAYCSARVDEKIMHELEVATTPPDGDNEASPGGTG